VKLRYDFESGGSDNDGDGSADSPMPLDGTGATVSADDTGSRDDVATPGEDGFFLAPLGGAEGNLGYIFGAGAFLPSGAIRLSAGANPAVAGISFGNDPNPSPGETARSSETFLDSYGIISAPSAVSISIQAPPASGGLSAANGSGGTILPAPGQSGGGSLAVPAFGEPPGGEPQVSGGASGPAPAGSPGGTLPLVGDLGTIYQAPTPSQSDSGGSSGSSPASAPSSNASGFVINVSYDQSVSSLPAGFVAAINDVVSYYESIFTAPITVNIDVGYGSIDGQQLQSDALGESETFLGDYSYSSIVNALAGVDASAAASLPSSMPVNGTMWIGTAEAKALGLPLEQPSTDIDGFAGFSNVFPFTYDPTNRAVPSAYDFIGVVEHEFTEVMGRIDLFGASIGGTTGYSLLDMFHYTAPGHHTYTGLTTNYFSANGGTTSLDYFNSNLGGDLGDWAGSAGADSYLAFTPTDEQDTVSQSDITEMNALGYRLSGQTGSGSSTPPQPANTTANVILERASDGTYEVYDIGGNTILATGVLGQISTQWQVVGLGGFNGTDTSDMILRNASGTFQIYDVANNTFTGNTTIGQVGMEWSVAGFGDFSGRTGETDMLMRNDNTGRLEVYDISSNAITFATGMGQVGLEWQVSGFGDFSSRAGETGDMLMRNSNTGQFEVYDISNNQITSAGPMGQVGLEWQVAGFGDFSGRANETDMLMRNSNTGTFELYHIANNQITFAGPMGQVGLEWQVVGFGPMGGTGPGDMLMRNSNTGAFEVYDIANNRIMTAAAVGQVGAEWSVTGIAAVSASSSSSADAQLAQAMASFTPAGGAAGSGGAPDPLTSQPQTSNPFASPNQAHPAG
jgi:hypothetical protein